MTTKHILARRDGHLLEVTINRPQARNSLHPPANDELDEVFDASSPTRTCGGDPHRSGDKAFSAGNDLVYSASASRCGAQERVRRADQPPRDDQASDRRSERFRDGGGCEIALACHLVVADTSAHFALSEVKVGVVAGAGGLVAAAARVRRRSPTR